MASCRCPLSPDSTLRLGLLTTDLLRARRVPRPRGTCQRFRLPRPLFHSPRGDADCRGLCSFLLLAARALSGVSRGCLLRLPNKQAPRLAKLSVLATFPPHLLDTTPREISSRRPNRTRAYDSSRTIRYDSRGSQRGTVFGTRLVLDLAKERIDGGSGCPRNRGVKVELGRTGG